MSAQMFASLRQPALRFTSNSPAIQPLRKLIATPCRSFTVAPAFKPVPRTPKTSLLGLVGFGTLALATSTLSLSSYRQPLKCESVALPGTAPSHSIDAQTPERLNLSVGSLGFGTMAGICCGVFVKKGLKAVAFLLGGAFVLLQYLSFQSISKTDFAALGSKYESAMDKLAGVAGKDGVTGAVGRAGNRVNRIGSRFIDFLMADFPPRATFVAGFFLGLRLG